MKRGWTTRIVLRYALFQVPGVLVLVGVLLVLKPWVELPSWLCWGLVGLWILHDAVMFPFVWRSYDPQPVDNSALVGASAVAVERLAPKGYVQVCGERWQAELQGDAQSVDAGARVQVQGIRGLTLLVSLPEAPPSEAAPHPALSPDK